VKRARGFLFAGCFCLATAAGAAPPSNVQFSAQVVKSTPEKKTQQSQIFVGDNQVRVEHQQDAQTMVQIFDMKNQRVVMLVPEQASYMERKVPVQGQVNPMLPPTDSNPCSRAPDAQCKLLGSESLYGREVSKWEMVVSHEDKTLRSLHWMDEERHMPLREQWPDGTVSELRLMGYEKLHGRATERWEMKTTRPDGESMQSTQWYDPELQIAIREELPGGFFRELRNIRVGAQPAHLFTVPADYQRLKPEQQQPKAPTGAPQQQRAPEPARQ
jgi:hypothetical protein